ncbi:hypothetical protein HY948_00035 [Candidatus Gottesmanbacteria bacterium]|nr:hypothetical protein [Candidatus Gottesmanbacteria bacterium]
MTPNIVPTIWFGTKLLTLVGLGVYTVFAGVMVRQELLMADVLEEAFEPVLRIIVLAHLVASIVVLFLAVVLL